MKRMIYAVGLLLLLAQCRTAKMALPNEEWDAKEEYKVSGKQALFSKEHMSFGPYYTTSIKRSWTKGSGSRFGLGKGNVTDQDYTNIISLDHIKRRQTIRFSMTDGQRQSETYCVSNFDTKELIIGNRPNSLVNLGIDAVKSILMMPDSKYYVQIYTAKGERPWEILLDNTKTAWEPGKYKGYLVKSARDYFTIVPVRKMEGKNGAASPILFGYIGFEFRNSLGEPVAAVSLIDKGMIYFQKVSAEEKFILANACAALLMQEVLG